MEKKVTNCGECPFRGIDKNYDTICNHPVDNSVFWLSPYQSGIIHEYCPEGGEFLITTTKIQENEQH